MNPEQLCKTNIFHVNKKSGYKQNELFLIGIERYTNINGNCKLSSTIDEDFGLQEYC